MKPRGEPDGLREIEKASGETPMRPIADEGRDRSSSESLREEIEKAMILKSWMGEMSVADAVSVALEMVQRERIELQGATDALDSQVKRAEAAESRADYWQKQAGAIEDEMRQERDEARQTAIDLGHGRVHHHDADEPDGPCVICERDEARKECAALSETLHAANEDAVEEARRAAGVHELVNSAVPPCNHPLAFFRKNSNDCRLCREIAAARLAGIEHALNEVVHEQRIPKVVAVWVNEVLRDRLRREAGK